jgi:hypothetical protein
MTRRLLFAMIAVSLVAVVGRADDDANITRHIRQKKLTELGDADQMKACIYLVKKEAEVPIDRKKPEGGKVIKQALVGVSLKPEAYTLEWVPEEELNAIEPGWPKDWDKLARAAHRIGNRKEGYVTAFYLGEHTKRDTDGKEVYRMAFLKKEAASLVNYGEKEFPGLNAADFQDKIVMASKKVDASDTYNMAIPVCEYGKEGGVQHCTFVLIKRDFSEIIAYPLGKD